jgi:short-subunit dehydrogenase
LTGASSGIGAALAGELSRRGARVAVTARRREALEELAAAHPGLRVEPGDVTDAAAMARIAEALTTDWGGIDLVLLSAGTYRPVTPATFTADIVKEHIAVNVMGVVNCMQAALPGMLERRAGRIAVVSSVTAFAGLPLAAAYGASKAFVNSMCDSLRPDLEAQGVGMTVIAPGFVRTPLVRQNAFRMPFMVEVDVAARIICDGIATERAEIAFPTQMAVFMKVLAALPAPLRRRYVARMAGRRRADKVRE